MGPSSCGEPLKSHSRLLCAHEIPPICDMLPLATLAAQATLVPSHVTAIGRQGSKGLESSGIVLALSEGGAGGAGPWAGGAAGHRSPSFLGRFHILSLSSAQLPGGGQASLVTSQGPQAMSQLFLIPEKVCGIGLPDKSQIAQLNLNLLKNK